MKMHNQVVESAAAARESAGARAGAGRGSRARTLTLTRTLTLALALALGACPSDSEKARTVDECSESACECVFSKECPSPMQCINGTCATTAVTPDASDGDATPDGSSETTSEPTHDASATSSDGRDAVDTGAFGAPCFTAEDCDSRYCVDSVEGGYCTRQCGEGCPDGYRCEQSQGRGDPISLCVFDESRLCRPCIDDQSCGAGGSDLCLSIGGGNFCARDCENDPCPSGYTCQDAQPRVGEPRRQCIPDNGTCDCTNASAGLVKSCTSENSNGTCFGIATCDPEQGFINCTARVPEAEICNGLDDDCDGTTDEEQAASDCTNTNTLGSCTGTETCQGPLGRVCSAKTPSAEACNGIDDDCDDETDEGFQTDGVYDTVENCGACGLDCHAQFEHAADVSCDTSDGTPHCVLVACDPGYILFGGTACIDENATLCTPCDSDSDCYGSGSRCLQVSSTDLRTFCARDCSGTGETTANCPDSYACDAVAGGTPQCMPVTDSCDCTANNAGQTKACTRTGSTGGLGTCFGLETCDAALGWTGCTASTPSNEVCNGADDDCDGSVDEGVAVGGACQVTNSFGTCDGNEFCNATLGLACDARTPASDVCNGQDDDCDGQTDEGFATTVGNTLKYDLSTAHCGACNYQCPPVAHGTVTCDGSGATPRCLVGDCDDGYYPLDGVVCVPIPTAGSCATCATDADCAGPADRCVDDGNGNLRCARDCGAGSIYGTTARPCSGEDGAQDCCPDDYQCEAFGNDRLCRPTSGTCDCIVDGATLACQTSNGFGTCNGVRTCELDGVPGLSACSARTPAAETCDGEDNDCDGAVDAGDPSMTTAATPNGQATCGPGPGCPGTWSCVGAAWECSARAAGDETCDNIDNDCDGQTDETYRDGAGRYVDDANCGACGLDCEALVVNATGVDCQVVAGQPTCLATSCAPGTYAFDGGRACLALPDNLCQACTSNNDCLVPGSRCLGSGAERYCGHSCAAGSPYGTTCPTGYACVDQGGGDRQCAPVSGSCVCGPGAVGLERACPVGACTGLQECQQNGNNYGFSACSAEGVIPEVCDGADNDCDGTTDETFRNGGVYDTVNACGGCGNDCTVRWPADQNVQTAACATTPTFRCVIAQCATKNGNEYVDTNGLPGDGCECARNPGNTTIDLPDSDFGNSFPAAGATYRDENCDGIDGVVGNALFVSAANTQAGNGTRANPYRTISAAIAAFTASGKSYILVAGGDYRENITLTANVKLHGGYSGDFGRRDIATFETRILGVEPNFGGGSVLPGTVYVTGIANSTTNVTLLSGFVVRGYDVTTAPSAGGQGFSSYAIYVVDSQQGLQLLNNRIVGGLGGPGGDGTSGAAGYGRQSGGGTALDGANGVNADTGPGCPASPCGSANHRAGGAAGVNATCSAASGIAGGTAVCPVYNQASWTPPTSVDGLAGFHWTRDAATNNTNTAGNECNNHLTEAGYPTNIKKLDGLDGSPGPDGGEGLQGLGCAQAQGSWSAGQWTNVAGAGGVTGALGARGGAGAPSGGIATATTAQLSGTGVNPHPADHYRIGASGGGAGAGGCGGNGGAAGGSGGASISVFVTFVSVTNPATLPIFRANLVERGLGGDGGSGGFGGAGGVPGNGGRGGGSQDFWVGFRAGNGGRGGFGGEGGGGGGGCGGASFGLTVWQHPATLSVTYATNNAFVQAETVVTGGTGGTPGPSGQARTGAAGVDGLTKNLQVVPKP